MYETILNCPECGFQVHLVADEVDAERKRFRAALEQIASLRPISHYAHPWNFDKRVRQIARAALEAKP